MFSGLGAKKFFVQLKSKMYKKGSEGHLRQWSKPLLAPEDNAQANSNISTPN